MKCKHCEFEAESFETHKGWWVCTNPDGRHIFPASKREIAAWERTDDTEEIQRNAGEVLEVEPEESTFKPSPPKRKPRRKKARKKK